MVPCDVTDYPFDLGSLRWSATSKHKDVNAWYSRGLVWCWAFHHEEAVWCFEQCLALDPECAMAHWGIAFAHGPNYNVHNNSGYPMLAATDDFPSMRTAVHHAEKAAQLATKVSGVTDVERALIGALQKRYAWPIPDKLRLDKLFEEFADAMRVVASNYPQDADVQAIFGEALMDMTPWQLFDGKTYAEAPLVAEIRRVLEHARALEPNHPGANHLYIHLCEMSPYPERALEACTSLVGKNADGVGASVPDGPHLLHMPSHIYCILGDYGAAIRANTAAHSANRKAYVGKHAEHAGTDFYRGYAAHDLHMLVYAAMLTGAETKARGYVDQVEDFLTYESIQAPYLAETLESFVALRPHVLVRFGLWEEILELAFPDKPDFYVATTATIRYARAVALAALGRVEEAEEEEKLFHKACSRMEGDSPIKRIMHNNTVAQDLAVGKKLVRGEILYRRGRLAQEKSGGNAGDEDLKAAFEVLREAVTLEDDLAYDEPWGWMVPVRHALGGLLLEQGRAEEAAAAFRSDLTGIEGEPLPDAAAACCASRATKHRHNRHPNNVWAIVGLRSCFAAGAKRQSLQESAEAMDAMLKAAQSDTDVVVTASCACVRSLPGPTKKTTSLL
eukprot:TRINITY_DN5916_c0_g1_i1.p1 TRINITY_DN5916_c0_g1~~TRINITY_DN5916_c0_g1_i1.p1  ORF type:complete len:618 (-),score=125.32 TRINITY_DN5916_c0_g1_i1:42-1895(-)